MNGDRSELQNLLGLDQMTQIGPAEVAAGSSRTLDQRRESAAYVALRMTTLPWLVRAVPCRAMRVGEDTVKHVDATNRPLQQAVRVPTPSGSAAFPLGSGER